MRMCNVYNIPVSDTYLERNKCAKVLPVWLDGKVHHHAEKITFWVSSNLSAMERCKGSRRISMYFLAFTAPFPTPAWEMHPHTIWPCGSFTVPLMQSGWYFSDCRRRKYRIPSKPWRLNFRFVGKYHLLPVVCCPLFISFAHFSRADFIFMVSSGFSAGRLAGSSILQSRLRIVRVVICRPSTLSHDGFRSVDVADLFLSASLFK